MNKNVFMENFVEYWDLDCIDFHCNYDIVNIDFLYQIGDIKQIITLLEKYNSDIQEIIFLKNILTTKIKKELLFKYEDKHQILIAIIYLKDKIKNNELLTEEALEIFLSVFYNCKYNIAKIYVAKMMIRYFCNVDFEERKKFFIPMRHGGSIHHFLFFLHSTTNTLGGKIYWDIYNHNMKKFLEIENNKKKIAICFYGVLRGHWENNLCDLLSNLEYLKADCFLLTWNEYQEWPGFMGGLNWADRCFPKEISIKVPEYIKTKENFQKFLPKTAVLFQSEYFKSVNQKDIVNIKNKYDSFKDYCLKPQPDFQTISRGKIMFYGIYNAFKLIEQYEYRNNFEYDYILLLRNDIALTGSIDINKIYNIEEGEISDYYTLWGGSGSGNFLGKRKTMKIYASLYEKFDKLKENKFIVNVYDNHEISYKFLAMHDIRLVKQIIPFNIQNEKLKTGYKIPDFSNALFQDLQQYNGKDNKFVDEIKYFFSLLAQKYKFVDKFSRRFDRFEQINIDKYSNKLSFKLGIVVLENIQNIKNILLIPYRLYQVKCKHYDATNQRTNTYKDVDIKTIILADKIGSEIIKANKTWYKGGYIKLLFKIRKLKREYKNKLDNE